MTIAAPFFLWVAGAAALATVAAHLFAWRRPPAVPLPTARFAPERPARVVSRAIRPTDIALLVLRVGILMLIGFALARPTVTRERRGTARVVVLDRSRSGGDGADVTGTGRSLLQPGDALVVFDSVAREIPFATRDSVAATGSPERRSSARGSLSAALVAAVRAGERLSRERARVELIIVSPLTADQFDAATGAIAQRWPGTIRSIRTRWDRFDTATVVARPEIRAAPGDPVAAAVGLIGPLAGGERVRVGRDGLSAADSAWVRGGGSLVLWPANPNAVGWDPRPTKDTTYAVLAIGGADVGVAGGAAVVAPFERTVRPPTGRVVARWSDGEPAATDVALGSGCIRAVAVQVPAKGDLPLTPGFRQFARRIVEPCDGPLALTRAPDSVVAPLLRRSENAVIPRAGSGAGRTTSVPSRLAAWLLAAAIVLAGAELLRRRGESLAPA